MAELTPEAKAELAEAFRIIKEDKFVQHLRKSFPAPKADPLITDTPPTPTPPPPPTPGPGPAPTPPTPPVVTPPPRQDPPTPPVVKKRVSRYWGTEFDE